MKWLKDNWLFLSVVAGMLTAHYTLAGDVRVLQSQKMDISDRLNRIEQKIDFLIYDKK
jgi:hypothetical protein